MSYKPKHPVRIVTAASLFDGHDASINIMRRVLQDMGAEVIHLGHNRSVFDVVTTALQEGAQGIAVSSYQGGHMEYFKYMKDLLEQSGAGYVRIFGGGGGVIIHEEKQELEAFGIAQIFHPDDGRRLGLEGMIEMIIRECDFVVPKSVDPVKAAPKEFLGNSIPHRDLGLAISAIENGESLEGFKSALGPFRRSDKKTPLVLGVTGTGGAGKSSLVDELVQRLLNSLPGVKVGIVCVDPTKRRTGGSLLGDRIRMNSLSRAGTFMRSVASRGSGSEISKALPPILDFLKTLDFDLLIAESSGIGQASSAITEVSDLSLYVMTSEFGAQSQLEKIDMIDYADLIAINKADHRGSQDAHRDVIKQYKRSRKLFHTEETVPVFLTQASNFNDSGVNDLFFGLCEKLSECVKKQVSAVDPGWKLSDLARSEFRGSQKQTIVPADRQNYLAEITHSVRQYKKQVNEKAEVASELGARKKLGLDTSEVEAKLSKKDLEDLDQFPKLQEQYSGDALVYHVRGKEIRQPLTRLSLSGLPIPRVVVPRITDWGDRLRYLRLENVPGEFPYTAGVFPLRREGEDPTRQFAGEGPPERTNRRFHFLSKDSDVKRLSTAFDSVTLYGEDPHERPDIFGKVGESGVSIATLDDMKRLYQGFDLCDPRTSVSMTINGPAPMMLAFFMNTAIDQQVEKAQAEQGRELTPGERSDIEKSTMSQVRGTVQADILKEDQGQNTCIFSIDFALKMMGDIQEYFVGNDIRNFYSVSISGYHIAEAGANPITQLALTLSNAFTYVEYYLSRGLDIDQFAPNLSFFFSNGLDPEYTVIGRVARRIWSIAIRDLYQGNERSQKLKYHIQTSGRSLHAQEIDFNDIRTTLQALIAINDNCNSLHTNAYDEAITTPTEESVRRAQAIQMIINREFGMAKNENPMQGSYFVEWLTDEVEEAVLDEFLRLSERGGVLGAMETQYQRGKIQEESLYYESLKHSGDLPIVGVNTFINPKTLEDGYVPPKIELARASLEEKNLQLDRTREFQQAHKTEAERELAHLRKEAIGGGNVFAALMRASRYCTLHQMSQALYEVGGQYRRNL
ncbi:MAG: cobalamin B12-binding domain-containing protein [Pseudobdellovibrionaceae bacterium]|nr:cobalamin-dependent protein [Bdellovibrionales bacterium]USN48297.1 MAG: cobalamin B12-binding domain-containing protein [Pseudobdellovibrionaceae bacterium]